MDIVVVRPGHSDPDDVSILSEQLLYDRSEAVVVIWVDNLDNIQVGESWDFFKPLHI